MLVNKVAINIKNTVNIKPDIPLKIGVKTVFKNGVIPVFSLVSTEPNKIADVHKKKVGQAKSLPMT